MVASKHISSTIRTHLQKQTRGKSSTTSTIWQDGRSSGRNRTYIHMHSTLFSRLKHHTRVIYAYRLMSAHPQGHRYSLVVISLVLEARSALLSLTTLGELPNQPQTSSRPTLKVLPKLRDCCKVVLNISYRRISASDTDRRANRMAYLSD